MPTIRLRPPARTSLITSHSLPSSLRGSVALPLNPSFLGTFAGGSFFCKRKAKHARCPGDRAAMSSASHSSLPRGAASEPILSPEECDHHGPFCGYFPMTRGASDSAGG